MTIVIDASMAISFALADEFTPRSSRVLDEVSRAGALVPYLWEYEVANALRSAERRGRLTTAAAISAARGIAALRIDRRPLDDPERVLALARHTDLSIYDAAYLDLCLQSGLALATLVAALEDAARRMGVRLVD